MLKRVQSPQHFIEPLDHLVRLLFLLDEKAAMLAVSTPNRAMPASIKKAAIPLPAGVTGKVSP